MNNLYYLIGLVLGDGHVDEKRKEITISTCSFLFKSKIEKIAKKVAEKVWIVWDDTSKMWRIKIKSQELFKLLQVVNGTGKKFDRFTLKHFITLEKEKLASLVAGLFDADGWIEKNGNYWRLRIKLKNKQAIDELFHILFQIFNLKVSRNKRKDNTYLVNILTKTHVKKAFSLFPFLRLSLR